MTWLDDLTLDTVIVHTTDGPSLKAVKQAVHDDCIVLRDCFLLEPEAQEMIQGTVVVPREKVLFMQVLGGASE
jgi:hypothetical protein